MYARDAHRVAILDTDMGFDYRAWSAVSGASVWLSNPLERIYELEQQEDYAPEDGQRKEALDSHERFVLTLRLVDDPELMAEYKRIHGIGMAWPEVTANMKQVGVLDMELYLHGSRAFMIMETVLGFDPDVVGPRWSALPREREWQQYVSRFQHGDPDAASGNRWLFMERA